MDVDVEAIGIEYDRALAIGRQHAAVAVQRLAQRDLALAQALARPVLAAVWEQQLREPGAVHGLACEREVGEQRPVLHDVGHQ